MNERTKLDLDKLEEVAALLKHINEMDSNIRDISSEKFDRDVIAKPRPIESRPNKPIKPTEPKAPEEPVKRKVYFERPKLPKAALAWYIPLVFVVGLPALLLIVQEFFSRPPIVMIIVPLCVALPTILWYPIALLIAFLVKLGPYNKEVRARDAEYKVACDLYPTQIDLYKKGARSVDVMYKAALEEYNVEAASYDSRLEQWQKKKAAYDKRYQKYLDMINDKEKEFEREKQLKIDKYKSENHYEEAETALNDLITGFIGREYLYDLDRIKSYISNGRAESVKEALMVFENEKFKEQQLNLLNERNEEIERNNRELENMQRKNLRYQEEMAEAERERVRNEERFHREQLRMDEERKREEISMQKSEARRSQSNINRQCYACKNIGQCPNAFKYENCPRFVHK